MTPQEIEERNEQLALMLGYKITWLDKLFFTWKCRFLHDWSLLMEAVEFIEKLGYESLLGGSEYYYPEKDMRYIHHFIKDNTTIYHESKDKKEAVFIAVSDFAKLYNNKEL
jgi:hypothetical protein